ncbi:MAG: polysaccharide pyruvyl transferase family protein [Proteobacteria bacterium]|nr:polysaccharide pyruvyl transferase family protein [Pseudomonadota bacterium]
MTNFDAEKFPKIVDTRSLRDLNYPKGKADAVSATHAIAELTSLLSQIIRGRRCVLLDWPNYANIGDHLIWLGQKIIFRKFLNLEITYQSNYLETDFDRIAQLDDTVILCSGGGNFGDLYIHHQKFREDIVCRFPNREIIFLPQTVYYLDSRRAWMSSSALKAHRNLTIFTRDLASYETLSSMKLKAQIYLGIDSAFALQGLIPRLAHRFSTDRKRPLYLLRQDRESNSVGIERPADALLVDWVAEDSLDWVMSEEATVSVIDELQLQDLIDTDWELRSLIHFVRAICLFAQASYVITDRLHAHILALMMGIDNEVYDNTYGKIGAFAKTWTDDDPLVTLHTAS